MIAWGKTARGFAIGTFRDRYKTLGSIQESSVAWDEGDNPMTQGPCIWLGVESDGPNVEDATRLHLSREMAGELGRQLLRFHDTGEIGP